MRPIFIYCLIFTALLIGFTFHLGSEEAAKPQEKKADLVVYTLDNGMKICLKPTDFETDEILFKLSALGGFASLDAKDQASGQIAMQAGWESGMEGMTSDQVSVYLYEHCLDFFPKIQAFSRTVEGSGCRKGLESFLKCLSIFFTRSNFTKVGYETALAQAKVSSDKHKHDFEQFYESAFLATNTKGFEPLRPLSVEDWDKADFDEAKQFFHNSFSNPSDFVCVIVGCFEIDEAKSLIEKYLGNIPAPREMFQFKKPVPPSFPKGITKNLIPVSVKKDSLTRVTFPLKMALNEENILLLEFVCQIVEARLRRTITAQMKISHGIDVAYEFPIYPFLDNPWMTIQFRSEAKLVNTLIYMILAELKNLQSKGALAEEIEEIKKFEKGSDEFWVLDNRYWLAMLSNSFLWGWNPQHRNCEKILSLNSSSINHFLETHLSLDNYSIVTAQ